MISREKIERDFHFDDGITSGRFDQTQIGKVAPRLVRKILNSARNNNNDNGYNNNGYNNNGYNNNNITVEIV